MGFWLFVHRSMYDAFKWVKTLLWNGWIFRVKVGSSSLLVNTLILLSEYSGQTDIVPLIIAIKLKMGLCRLWIRSGRHCASSSIVTENYSSRHCASYS